MKISIKSDVFKKFNPKLKIAFIFVTEMDNKSKTKESKHLLKEIENLTRLSYHKNTPDSHDFIVPWTLAKMDFGKKAKHYNTSLEKLLKIVLKGRSIGKMDVLNNVLNYVALKHMVPIGVDNFQKIDGDLNFNVVKKASRRGILGLLKKQDFFYTDNKGVLGTKLDFWKNRRTFTTASSKSALVHIESLPPISKKKLNQVLKEAVSLIESFCNAKTKVFILDKTNKTIMV